MSTKGFRRGLGVALSCVVVTVAIGCKDKKQADAPAAPASAPSESPIKKGATDVGEGAGDAWKGMKTAGEDVGHESAKIGKKIGSETSTGAKDVAAGTKKAADDVGEGMSDGVKKVDGKSDDKTDAKPDAKPDGTTNDNSDAKSQ
jgi:hypothetical protein